MNSCPPQGSGLIQSQVISDGTPFPGADIISMYNAITSVSNIYGIAANFLVPSGYAITVSQPVVIPPANTFTIQSGGTLQIVG